MSISLTCFWIKLPSSQGTTVQFVYRRLEEPAFQQRLQQVRSDMVLRTAGALTAASQEAVRTLLSLQKETVPPGVRLGAARAVIELGLKVREMAEIELRLAELEQRLGVEAK